MHLKTANGFLSTATTAPTTDDHHLGQVLPMMQDAAAMKLPPTLMHVIDREADSVLDRPAQHRVDGQVTSIPGEALALRLVVGRTPFTARLMLAKDFKPHVH